MDHLLEILIPTVIAPLLGALIDRIRYGKQIANAAAAIAVQSGNKTARQIAEQAVIAHNQIEIERAVKGLEILQRDQAVAERAGLARGKRNADLIETHVLGPDEPMPPDPEKPQ